MLTSQNVGSYVTGVAFHPTKNLVASCSYDKSVKLWNADTRAELWTVKVDGEVSSVAFSIECSKLAVTFNFYDRDHESDSGIVKIYSNQESAGFV